jgi:hypothetical protein
VVVTIVQTENAGYANAAAARHVAVTGGIGEGEVGIIENVVVVRVVGIGRHRTAGDGIESERKPWLVQSDETQREAHPFGERGTDLGAEAGSHPTTSSNGTGHAGAVPTGTYQNEGQKNSQTGTRHLGPPVGTAER